MADEPDKPENPEGTEESTQAVADVEDAVEKGDAAIETGESGDQSGGPFARLRRRVNPRRLSNVGSALLAGAVIVATLAGSAGWLGYRTYEKREAQRQRDTFVQVARQGAVNLTTINYTEVDADVQRIIDSSTGAFHDDFLQRSKAFAEVVKAAQSKSEGTVTDAGLESQHGGSGQVLVAVSVKSRTAGGEEAPRVWRMKVEVQAIGDDAKVANVMFVP